MALPQRQISHISVKSIFSAAAISSSGLPAVTLLSSWRTSSLYLAASSMTAGREDLKVDIFWRAKTS